MAVIMDQVKMGMVHTASLLLYVATCSHDALDENLSPTTVPSVRPGRQRELREW
jgi:hypothetical protein